MELLHWHDSFSVGIRIIDDQHQQLFLLVNELIQAVNDHQEGKVLDGILQSVLAYTHVHFKTEEELFSIHPRYAAHCAVHRQFAGHVRDISFHLAGNKEEAASRLLRDLIKWLRNHILKMDILFFSELGYRPRETQEDFEARLRILTHKEKVLVVDDSSFQREMIKKYLEMEGFAVLEAAGGSAALTLIEKTPDLHLVITDISMPGMSGYDLIDAIRDRTHLSIYLIVISALTDTEAPIKSLSLGANDFMTKPIRLRELLLRLRNGSHFIRLASQDELIFSMAQLADHRSPETGRHLDRVQRFTRLLGRQLIRSASESGMTESIAADIARFSPLHDIGKVAIPDHILNKRGKLTPEEFALMKEHARIGGELISTILRKTASRSLRLAFELTMYHHERWDGSGYPIGLVGTDIPIAARIMALADVYDALTSERVYKRAFTREEARTVIVNSAGSHLDPMLVTAFEAVEAQFHHLREQLRD